MELLHSGKVREIYSDRGDIVLVASDRVSVYDVVLPTTIPDKGALLTQLSLWWFGKTADVVDNHVISADDVPAEVAGRAIRCRRLEMLPVECVARGYLTGSGLKDYQRTGAVSGVRLPAGLVDGSKLPEPIFTPSSKAPAGQHDEAITFDDVVALLGADTAAQLRDATLELYRRGATLAAANGILMADTKFEFGRDASGALVLGDEIFTSDSSRYWPADDWEPGRPQRSFDKQIVRDWAAGTGWDKTAPGPAVPAEVVELARSRYIELYQRITGQHWGS
ncbi:MAG: phosphoribosylaminoimidazole-succinocarboxamide synthase [Pseudonocardiales bacterium]|jgi:phosphoribosylaminoimidazole-succinocarboxamide synthase|uniref:phosphoribosylaminoimidazolesuccinocarboxamide synthase n=1 Tax=Pseudonocardia sp. Cha107L01 TaxID=3457576 RepID=UPI0028C63F36|nr:phosphoribosylaminoimidazole-succinocarboxamide synthase [Pseudonocardiales bacterium]MDT7748135.1 phosphoribosylaminoimidazole-succinocarboxamide synthase [Pseudonocardiales bacterium]MDT7771848.1 phosphoribosylaminoimidazole-succinocarboxamide synthase [Pseudonocardiales bacterium]